MRGRFFFLMMVVLFFSCEDPTTLPVSKVFSNNKLQTIFVDTFSVVTSTIQLDSLLTNGTGTILLGRYHDKDLGFIESSSYFQILPSGSFAPDSKNDIFDSVALIMPYNHSYIGDTSKNLTINVNQLKEQIKYRLLPAIGFDELKLSTFNSSNGLFNSTKFSYYSTPILTFSTKVTPHKDSIYVRLPDSFGANWFRLAQKDTAVRQPTATGQEVGLFRNLNVFEGETAPDFVASFFNGIRLSVDPTSDASIVGFKAGSFKIRIYYKKFSGENWNKAFFDFKLFNGALQFNHIDYDRTGTAFASVSKLKAVSSSLTGNITYVQSGTGLVTRLDFPTLKKFFQLNNNVIINTAYLDIQPVRGSYPLNMLPPTSLSLYSTDDSNLPLPSYLASAPGLPITASIQYDYEFGLNTVYRYPVFSYLLSQLKSTTDYITPLILAPAAGQGSSVQRVYLGDRFYPESKIKLKIFYSYVLN